MEVSETKRLKTLKEENAKLKKLLAESMMAGKYNIETTRYFKLDNSIGWVQVQRNVANLRSATGMPPAPSFRDEDGQLVHDLIDVYPATAEKPAFAVAMAQKPLADGSGLIGYFALTAK